MTLYIQPYPFAFAQDRPFRRMAHRWMAFNQTPSRTNALGVNIREEDESYILSALVPGLKAEDLNIQVLDDTFYITPFSYPQYIEIPADETTNRYGGYANVLINDRKVYTLFIHPDVANAEFLSYVGTTGAMIIGTEMPEPRPGGWVMTIQPDTIKAIQTSWPNLIAGQGGVNVQSPLGIADDVVLK